MLRKISSIVLSLMVVFSTLSVVAAAKTGSVSGYMLKMTTVDAANTDDRRIYSAIDVTAGEDYIFSA